MHTEINPSASHLLRLRHAADTPKKIMKDPPPTCGDGGESAGEVITRVFVVPPNEFATE